MEQDESRAIYLLKKGKRGLLYLVFSRIGLMFLMLAVQIYFLGLVFLKFEEILPYFWGGSVMFSMSMVLYMLNTQMDPTAKITWLIIIMALPVFGGLMFCYTRSELGHRVLKARMNQIIQETREAIPQNQEALEHLAGVNEQAANLARYMNLSDVHPVFEHTKVTYFPMGEKKWGEMLKQLEKAEKFIFMEYFIVDEGLMWGRILDILARKAKEGVDVRVMYDGTCEFSTLPHDYPRRLKALGIQCKMFAPVSPFLSTHYNYRDHRKILVIDGHTAFNGGVNIADEYINRTVKYGHWKDTAVMLQGDAALSFTLMFLQMWNVSERELTVEPFISYSQSVAAQVQPVGQGFVIPYGDSPLDNDKVGEKVYMDLLNRAVRYVHIMTPYLILDGELEAALKFAAERGVDVRLMLPGIPDKKAPYALAKTHYASLLESGVKIYEYTPGFVHAKVFVTDDREAVVGTINLDYRSLYHHFECATYMYGTSCIREIEDDFQETLKQCREVSADTIRKEPLTRRLMGYVLKVIAPLM